MAGAPVERRDAAANRVRILRAARRMLREEGLASVSIDRIAAEAGVGKGTIFRRFGDRAGLTSALLDESMRAFQDAFLAGPPPLGPGAPASERLEAFVEAFLAMMDADLEIALAADRAAPATVAGALTLHVRGLVSQIDPRLDADLVATVLLGALSPLVIVRLRARGADLPAQQAATRAVLQGLTGCAPSSLSGTRPG